MTQMCKTEGNAGYLANKSRKRGEGEEVGCWMTMTEADRNKMPVVEKMMGDFLQINALFLTYYTVCMYVGRQQLRW